MTKAEKQARAARARALLGIGEVGSSPKTLNTGDQTNETQAPAPISAPPSTPTRKDRKATRSRTTSEPQQPAQYQEPNAAPMVAGPPRIPHPLKWPSPPAHGQMVFYGQDRMYVERAPESWADSVFVCISNLPVREGIDPKTGWPWARPEQRQSFHVYGDMIDEIPIDYNKRATRLPTPASVARAVRAKSGARDIGDEVASLLRGCGSLPDVYATASKFLSVPVGELENRYGKLNPGQQRMVLGNRMRAKWRKEHV